MQTAFRFRLESAAARDQILPIWIDCQRVVNNAKVHEGRYFCTVARKQVQRIGQLAPRAHQDAQFIGEGTAWLREGLSAILRNGASAKSGLDAAIPLCALSLDPKRQYRQGSARGRRCLAAPAQYILHDCAECGNLHPDNQPTQSIVIFRTTADTNVSQVNVQRAVDRCLSDWYREREDKRMMHLRQKQRAAQSHAQGDHRQTGLREQPHTRVAEPSNAHDDATR
jgi:hypothetical protein